jgi:hypothetical protein
MLPPSSACFLLHAGSCSKNKPSKRAGGKESLAYLLGLSFDPEDGSDMSPYNLKIPSFS